MHRNVLQKWSLDLEFKELQVFWLGELQVLQIFSIESFTVSKVPFCMEDLCFVNHYSLAIRAPNSGLLEEKVSKLTWTLANLVDRPAKLVGQLN